MQVRLSELYDVVDYFVITESAITHQNDPKPLYYKENAARFAKFADKIVHIELGRLQGTHPYTR